MHKKTLKNIHLRFDNYIGNIFYSIFIFTFLFKNSKLALIYFSDTLSVKEKIEILSWSDIAYVQPFLYACLITLIYVILNLIFYFLTIHYNKYKNTLIKKHLPKSDIIKDLKEEKKLAKLIKQDPKLAENKLDKKHINIKNKGYDS